PERFMQKTGNKIISQPIKGTAKRGKSPKEDLQIISSLEKDEKERAENVMIVDLVRNDLSRTAIEGSVKVEELCKVYSFQQVHQMISTVSSSVNKNLSPVEIIKKSFPMGSMTGAPKIRAMQLIDIYESTKRGLYSGSVGYFSPDGDFDFNVIIRSILYNADKHYLSFTVGGAITSKSDPEKEFDETLLKADAMFKILKHD
ncbi:MAG: anthranilate synthase component I family protein, partial [Flavobacteriales bacterium]|nr:anthranilate synthase component I family protein [Flavobacteriales bacterium]